jgi:hypothetical protein
MTTHLRDELIVVEHPLLGRVLYVLPVIPDNAPTTVREGIARRRTAALTGHCPCGARAHYPQQIKAGQVGTAQIVHHDRCPAVTATLAKAIRRWTR